jgi:hypothetical protein
MTAQQALSVQKNGAIRASNHVICTWDGQEPEAELNAVALGYRGQSVEGGDALRCRHGK